MSGSGTGSEGRENASGGTPRGDGRGVEQAVVKLVVRLERLLKADGPAQQRVDLLRGIDAKVVEVVSRLRKAAAETRPTEPPKGLSVEQRVYDLMVRNLKLALSEFDRSPSAYSSGAADDRWWLVRHLFLFLGMSIERSLRTDRPWAPGVWRELHDLFFYLVNRRDVSIFGKVGTRDRTFDPETEYKRLLLLGLIRQMVRRDDRPPDLMRRLQVWAAETGMREPEGYDGSFDLYQVEIAKDEPARERSGALQPGANVWILEPAQGFLDFVAGQSTGPFPSPAPPAGKG